MGAASRGLQEPLLRGSCKEIPQTDGLMLTLLFPAKAFNVKVNVMFISWLN